ncbi:MAG: hypothetical protein H6737_26460 [Alphaproteobacteria bacterium]|nr:hypothetical protein [Alphaproteobacteria bacterium]
MILLLSRALVPTAISRTMPGALALLFAISQVSAMVDFPGVAVQVQAAPIGARAVLAGALALLGGLGSIGTYRVLLYGPRAGFAWRMPVGDAALAGAFGTALLIPAVPTGVCALLLGPIPALAVMLLAAMVGAAGAARSPWALVFAGLAATATGPWAVLSALAGVALLGPLGRALRDGRPLGQPAVRTAWLRRGPVLALVQRDVLGLWRTWPATVAGLAVVPGVLAWLVQGALHRTWPPSAISTGSVLIVGAFGLLPAATLGAVAKVERGAQLARGLPVSPGERVMALLGTALLPLGPVVAGILVAGTANGPLGAVRVATVALVLASLAAAALLGRTTQRHREDLVSHGIAASVFVTLVAAISPWATPPLLALSAGAATLAVRRAG